MTWNVEDSFACASLLGLTGLFAGHFVDYGIPPFEDAAILMRYAEHVARGEGIVWNIGEAPVDGATDFLFMVLVAFVRWAGLSLEAAVRLVTIGAHVATVGLVYVGMRRVQRAGIAPAFLSAAYFAMGPGLFLSAAGFGTPLFTLVLALAWLLAQRLREARHRSLSGYLAFSFACLVLGLVRPEGVFMGVFMAAAVAALVPPADTRRLAVVFAAVFLTLGATYFVWRWSYFGHPLPNPFYKKGGGQLHWRALETSVRNGFRLALPFLPAFLLSMRSVATRRAGLAFSIPIAGSLAMWVLLSDEMNFGGRFQYPVLVLCVLSWYPLVEGLGERLPRLASLGAMRRAGLLVCTGGALALVFAAQISDARRIRYGRDGRKAVGVMLSDYADRGYTLATSESGLVPLYSGWRTVDTWGLNDPWIAHHGGITEEYLEAQEPDLILFHAFFSPLRPPSERHGGAWQRQVTTLKRYAEQHGFTLAAVFGAQPTNTHYYYVRADLPDHDEIVARIRGTDYAWFQGGRRSRNFAP